MASGSLFESALNLLGILAGWGLIAEEADVQRLAYVPKMALGPSE